MRSTRKYAVGFSRFVHSTTLVYTAYYHILHIPPHTVCIFADLCRCDSLRQCSGGRCCRRRWKHNFRRGDGAAEIGRVDWTAINEIARASKELADWMMKSCTKPRAFFQDGGQGKARCCLSLLLRWRTSVRPPISPIFHFHRFYPALRYITYPNNHLQHSS